MGLYLLTCGVINKSTISVLLLHDFKYFKKAKPMLILVLLGALSCSFFYLLVMLRHPLASDECTLFPLKTTLSGLKYKHL